MMEYNGNKINYIYDTKNSDTLVIMLHGLTMDSIMYPFNDLANDIYKLGYDVLRFDFIGHGKSYGESKDMTLEAEIEDAKFMIDSFKDNYKKLILLGHSQGGLIASYLAGIYNPYKLILLSPAYNLIDLVKSKTFFGKKIKEGMDLHIWNMTFTPKYFIGLSNEMYYNLNYPNKTIIIHGDKDILVPIYYSMEYEKKYSNVSLKIISNSDHEFIGHYQELIKEVGEALNE